jgi:subtilisin
VVDEKTKAPVAGVTVVLVVSRKEKKGYKQRTGDDGVAKFSVAAQTAHFELVGLLPKFGYWSRKLDDVAVDGDKMEIFIRPLPSPDSEVYTWAVQDTKMEDGAAKGGAGVKIAVIDTGIRKDHEDLRPAGGLNCVLHEDEANWFDDEIGHGTHCAGIIGALLNHKGLKSYAPESSMYAYRVFSNDEDSGAATFDIVKALSRAIADGCDVISMSLGSGTEQSAIRTQIEDAYNKGIVCVAASGNDGGPVSYPAAIKIVVAVGAYGKFGTFPDDSLHKDTESDHLDKDKERFVANFSNFGDEVDVIAPGVAIVSTVPGGYAAWDGTSMACPHVTGMAALALASHPEILNAPRDAARAERLIKLLTGATRKLGVGETYEGAGCPQVDLILAAK